MLAQALVFDGGEALYCTPTFPLYAILTKMFGGVPDRGSAYRVAL